MKKKTTSILRILPIPFLGSLLMFLSFSKPASCQSVWNVSSFKFSNDISPLENMTGATTVSFGGGPIQSSGSIPFPGFSFRYGLSSFSNFYISTYGFIKLGGPLASNIPGQDSVIVALYNATAWSARYKSVGNAPDRRMVIEFIGVMQPSGEPTSFQIWLYERTGKIQFVYEQVRGFYGFSSSWNYKIYCGARIMNKTAIAGVKIFPNNASPTVNYSAIPTSFDSIYANTRFTFQPDTVKPAIPSQLSFSNVQAGCLNVDFTENSSNESLVTLERSSDNGVNYAIEKLYYVSTPAGSTPYSYAQTFVQPFWTYKYRVYASNGFLNSDTLTNSVQTLMPQLNGVKKVPGDYPTVAALLQDAACKHLGPNLVIELQSNYDFAIEPKPVSFGSILQNRFIQSIVIRPAANANITWADSTRTALFYVDSVKHVFLDGRPGGAGNSQNFTIYQKNGQQAAIQYTNSADSGGINYCRVIQKNSTSLRSTILIIPKDSSFSYNKKHVNAFSLTNSFVSADTNTVYMLLQVAPTDSTGCRDFVISGNQFSRARGDAIYFDGGGENVQITNNRFFMPDPFDPQAFLPINTSSCIKLVNTGTAMIDNNSFGGSAIAWGTGIYTLSCVGPDKYNFIHYENTSDTKKAFIRNNKFANIHTNCLASVGGAETKMIYAYKGDVLIDNNRVGTADSTNSVTNNSYFWCFDLWYGTKTITNNFFSGIQADYPVITNHGSSQFITSLNADSSVFINNDVGGSDNPAANTAAGDIHGIYLLIDKNVIIKNNILRGFSSKDRAAVGISGANAISGTSELRLEVDSNTIHHIQASSKATAIALRPNSTAINRISYNHIYALKTTGLTIDPNGGGYLGTLYGINYSMYNYGLPPDKFKGELEVFGNKIHSFESIRTLPNSIFSQYGIYVSSPVTRIYNNEIRFGIDNKGLPIDTLTSVNGITIAPVDYGSFLSDKHFVEHNSIYFGGRGNTGSALHVEYSNNYVSPRNSLTVTNNIFNINRIPVSVIPPGLEIYEYISYIKTYSAKNIWHSTSIANTPALLQNYKNSCHCDSSSFVGNPVFINPAGDSSNYNLHLGAGSLADSAGTPSVLGISKDLDNKIRNAYSPVDIGSYAATPCGSGIFPDITLSPSEDSVQLCTGGTITLTATITGGTFQQLQWQVNLIDSIGQNGTSLIVNHPGSYRLVGKTTCGQVASKMIWVVNYPLQQSVTITAAPADSVCQGSTVTFTAVPVHCGINPVYQWKLNGMNVGTNSPVFSTASVNTGDSVKVVVTTSICGNGTTVTSNTIGIKVLPISAPTVTITANTSTICTGSPVTVIFSATATNGGNNPIYQWQLNGVNVGTNSATYSTAALNNNDQVKCILTSSSACASPPAATSNTITIFVINGTVAPSVNISTASTTTRSGSAVTFIATPVNGGVSPAYQWLVNGTNTGTNSSTFTTTTLTNGSTVSVIMTSSLSCASPASATSNTITMSVAAPVVPAVSITASPLTVCTGTTVTFTASAINGGTAPAFQWRKNGINVGANSSTYITNALSNGDVITVTLTSNATCANPSVVTSNSFTITIGSGSTAIINITGQTTVVEGSSSVIHSTIFNGGTSPSYQWQDSTHTHSWLNITGNNTSTITYTPAATGDRLRCILTGNNNCVVNPAVISNTLEFTVTPQFTGNIIRHYPDPAGRYLVIEGLAPMKHWETVHIITMSGMRTSIIKDITGLTRATIDVGSLPSGIYMAVLTTRFGDNAFFKFVKL